MAQAFNGACPTVTGPEQWLKNVDRSAVEHALSSPITII